MLFVSLFLPWYGTSSNPNAQINGARGTFDAFTTFKVLDILLVAACMARTQSRMNFARPGMEPPYSSSRRLAFIDRN